MNRLCVCVCVKCCWTSAQAVWFCKSIKQACENSFSHLKLELRRAARRLRTTFHVLLCTLPYTRRWVRQFDTCKSFCGQHTNNKKLCVKFKSLYGPRRCGKQALRVNIRSEKDRKRICCLSFALYDERFLLRFWLSAWPCWYYARVCHDLCSISIRKH